MLLVRASAVVILRKYTLEKTLLNMGFDFVKSYGSLRTMHYSVKLLGTTNTYSLFNTECEGERGILYDLLDPHQILLRIENVAIPVTKCQRYFQSSTLITNEKNLLISQNHSLSVKMLMGQFHMDCCIQMHSNLLLFF